MKMDNWLGRTLLRPLFDAFMPAVCELCGNPLIDGEDYMCTTCLVTLPRLRYHLSDYNDMMRRLVDPAIPVWKVAAWFPYVNGSQFAALLQHAKYSRRPDLARWLGATFAKELQDEAFFDGVDLLLPMPIHFFKKVRRGYNQSEEICLGISTVSGLPLADNLHARRHSSQTRKNALQRSRNVKDVYYLKYGSEMDGKHILLVDDIITTGSTLRAALNAIYAGSRPSAVSILTIGCTHRP